MGRTFSIPIKKYYNNFGWVITLLFQFFHNILRCSGFFRHPVNTRWGSSVNVYEGILCKYESKIWCDSFTRSGDIMIRVYYVLYIYILTWATPHFLWFDGRLSWQLLQIIHNCLLLTASIHKMESFTDNLNILFDINIITLVILCLRVQVCCLYMNVLSKHTTMLLNHCVLYVYV